MHLHVKKLRIKNTHREKIELEIILEKKGARNNPRDN